MPKARLISFTSWVVETGHSSDARKIPDFFCSITVCISWQRFPTKVKDLWLLIFPSGIKGHLLTIAIKLYMFAFTPVPYTNDVLTTASLKFLSSRLFTLCSPSCFAFLAASKARSLFIRETQISKTKCIEICKSNNPAESGGYNLPAGRLVPRHLGRYLGPGLALGFHTRDYEANIFWSHPLGGLRQRVG